MCIRLIRRSKLLVIVIGNYSLPSCAEFTGNQGILASSISYRFCPRAKKWRRSRFFRRRSSNATGNFTGWYAVAYCAVHVSICLLLTFYPPVDDRCIWLTLFGRFRVVGTLGNNIWHAFSDRLFKFWWQWRWYKFANDVFVSEFTAEFSDNIVVFYGFQQLLYTGPKGRRRYWFQWGAVSVHFQSCGKTLSVWWKILSCWLVGGTGCPAGLWVRRRSDTGLVLGWMRNWGTFGGCPKRNRQIPRLEIVFIIANRAICISVR